MTQERMINTILLAAAMALGALPASAQGLLPAQPGDLVAPASVSAQRSVNANDERQPLTYFQPLAADDSLDFAVQPHQAESREYWQRVDAARLRSGYALALTSPSAVVMISPGARSRALQPADVQILRNGQALDISQAADTLVDAASVRQTGMAMSEGSIGFRLRPGMEGDVTLRIGPARGDYLVHVFEPESPHVLRLRAGTDIVHAGATLIATLALDGGARLDAATALLVAPDGRSWNMSQGRDRAQVRMQLPADITVQPGLWEIHASTAAVDGSNAFQRDARTAIAVVVPTARLDGRLVQGRNRAGGGLDLGFGVDVGTAGRYELRAVLFGHDAQGREVPVGVSHAAAWLEPGSRVLSLSVPADALAGVKAPYRLRDLRLTDQSAVSVLERRTEAVLIP